MWSRIFLVAALLSTFLPVTQSSAATAIVRDGGTLQLGNVTYRLDGIDTPAFDQLCIDEHADVWTCGVEARDQLTKLIGDRQVRCDDLGIDPTYKKRHLGVCKIEGETTSLSQMIVRRDLASMSKHPQRTLPGRRGPRQGRSPGTLERLLRCPAGVPPLEKRRHPARRRLPPPTATAKSAKPCSPKTS